MKKDTAKNLQENLWFHTTLTPVNSRKTFPLKFIQSSLNFHYILGNLPADAQPEALLLQLGELGPVGHHYQCSHREAGGETSTNGGLAWLRSLSY